MESASPRTTRKSSTKKQRKKTPEKKFEDWAHLRINPSIHFPGRRVDRTRTYTVNEAQYDFTVGKYLYIFGKARFYEDELMSQKDFESYQQNLKDARKAQAEARATEKKTSGSGGSSNVNNAPVRTPEESFPATSLPATSLPAIAATHAPSPASTTKPASATTPAPGKKKAKKLAGKKAAAKGKHGTKRKLTESLSSESSSSESSSSESLSSESLSSESSSSESPDIKPVLNELKAKCTRQQSEISRKQSEITNLQLTITTLKHQSTQHIKHQKKMEKQITLLQGEKLKLKSLNEALDLKKLAFQRETQAQKAQQVYQQTQLVASSRYELEAHKASQRAAQKASEKMHQKPTPTPELFFGGGSRPRRTLSSAVGAFAGQVPPPPANGVHRVSPPVTPPTRTTDTTSHAEIKNQQRTFKMDVIQLFKDGLLTKHEMVEMLKSE